MSTRLNNAARAQPGAAAPARTFELTYSESARSRTSALKQNEATFSATCGRTQRLLSGRGSALGSPSRPAPARVGGCMEGDEVWPASHSSLSRTAVRSSRAKLQHHSCRSRHHVRPQRLAHDPGTHISRGGCTATSAGAGTAQVRDRASSMHARVQRCSPGAPHRHAARHGRRPPQRSTGAPRLSARHTSAARGRAACRAAPAAPPRAARPAAPRPQRAPRPRRSSSAARSRPRPSPPARRCARAVSTPQVRALALRAPAPSTESGTPKPSSSTRASPRMPGSQRLRVTPPLQQAPRRSRWCWPACQTACGPSARRPPKHRRARSSGLAPTAGRPSMAQRQRHRLLAQQRRRPAGHGSLPSAQCRPSEAPHALVTVTAHNT